MDDISESVVEVNELLSDKRGRGLNTNGRKPNDGAERLTPESWKTGLDF